MFKISKQNIQTLATYLDNSSLPHSDVKTILTLLTSLEEIKEEVKGEVKSEVKSEVKELKENK